jgi:hypothetical protein
MDYIVLTIIPNGLNTVATKVLLKKGKEFRTAEIILKNDEVLSVDDTTWDASEVAPDGGAIWRKNKKSDTRPTADKAVDNWEDLIDEGGDIDEIIASVKLGIKDNDVLNARFKRVNALLQKASDEKVRTLLSAWIVLGL